MGIYIGIRIYANVISYVPEEVDVMSKTNIGVLGGFLSFFLVLFVNQTNGRFLEMYGFSGLEGFSVALLYGLRLGRVGKLAHRKLKREKSIKIITKTPKDFRRRYAPPLKEVTLLSRRAAHPLNWGALDPSLGC